MDFDEITTVLESQNHKYGVKVDLEDEDIQNRAVFHVIDAKSKLNNKCMKIRINEDPTSKKKYMMIVSLKYHDYQKNCSVKPAHLVMWAQSFVHTKFIEYIELEDASRVDLESNNAKEERLLQVSISLKIVRKFFKGQSWYEQFGFLPVNNYNNRYSTTFEKVRNLSFDQVCVFLWLIIRMYVKDENTLNAVTGLDKINDNAPVYFAFVNRIINHEYTSFQDMILSNVILNNALQNIVAYGFPKSRVKEVQTTNTKVEQAFFDKFVRIRRDSKKTLLQTWIPYAKSFRKISIKPPEDVVLFYKAVNGTLTIFKLLDILHVPVYFQYSIENRRIQNM